MQIKADVQSALICINLRFSFYINELFYGKTMIKYLVVGLGNIGPEYHETRHNIGFMTVEALARINNAPPFMDGRYGFTTSFSIKGRQLIDFYEPEWIGRSLLDAERKYSIGKCADRSR